MTDSPNLALAEKIEQQIFLRYGPWCDIGLERKEWEQVIAALRAQPSGDWVMVPREPTVKMLEAGVMEAVGDSFVIHDERQLERIWREMLVAYDNE